MLKIFITIAEVRVQFKRAQQQQKALHVPPCSLPALSQQYEKSAAAAATTATATAPTATATATAPAATRNVDSNNDNIGNIYALATTFSGTHLLFMTTVIKKQPRRGKTRCLEMHFQQKRAAAAALAPQHVNSCV